MANASRLIRTGLGAALMILLSGALVAHAYIGSFSRLISDDYDHAARVRAHGFWGAQVEMYRSWGGRYASTLAVSVPAGFGSRLAPVLPALLLIAWLGCLTWAIYQLRPFTAWPKPLLTALFLAELILVTTLVTTPSVFQCLYWQTGALTYSLPLLLLSVYAGLAFRMAARAPLKPRWPTLLGGGVLAFLAGGFVEPVTAIQGGALALGCLFCGTRAAQRVRRGLLPFLAVGLAATALATIVILVAPGNEVRVASSATRSEVAPPRTMVALVGDSVRFGFQSVRYSVLTSRPTTLAAIALPAIVGLFFHGAGREPRPIGTTAGRGLLLALGVLPLAAFLLIVLAQMPHAYVSAFVRAGYNPQPRTYGVTQFVFFALASLWGYLGGCSLRRIRFLPTPLRAKTSFWIAAALAAVCLVVPFNAARRTLALAPIVRDHARQWDEQDRAIRAARAQGVSHVVVAALPGTERGEPGNLYFGLRLLGSDPDYWTNRCAAGYYGVASITAR